MSFARVPSLSDCLVTPLETLRTKHMHQEHKNFGTILVAQVVVTVTFIGSRCDLGARLETTKGLGNGQEGMQ